MSSDLAAPPDNRPIGVKSIEQCPVQLGGLALRSQRQVSAWAYELWDCRALKGPWSVLIRADGGEFGVHSAVATFPVDHAAAGAPVAQPEGAVWNPALQQLVWPLAGSHAQIVGDLGQTELVDLAMRMTVVAGKPHLGALDGFTASAIVPYQAALVHEMRYSTVDLGSEMKMADGAVYTGVMSGAFLESEVLRSGTRPAGLVRGRPAVYSDVEGGSGNLAWESTPGEVAYIGYRGSAKPASMIENLRALANGGRPLTAVQWQTKDLISAKRQSG